MKKILLGAAGVLLSSSAMAGVLMSDGATKTAPGLDESMIHNAMLIDWPEKAQPSVALTSSDAKAFGEAKQAEPAKPAASDSADSADAAVSTESKPTDEAMTTGSAPAETATAPAGAPETTPVAKPNGGGMGGPLETADAGTASLDLSPRAAAQNYPACAPGPGDDRCIQLYEPGVQTALASWSGQTGGFDNGQTGMGGPEEAVDETSAIEPAQEEAAYEPLPEDAVMPASEDVVLTDSPTSSSTMAI